MSDAAASLFAPPAEQWRRVSPKLATVRRISLSIWLGLLLVGGVVGAWLLSSWWWLAAIIAVIGLGLWLWLWILDGRFVRSLGYAERDGDLCITRGVLFRRLTIVPFGRLQVVKVSSGPLQKAYGLATVELVTASTQTDAAIPGLPMDEATALRDRLIELSDAQGSGL
jgi:uncharacterized protein